MATAESSGYIAYQRERFVTHLPEHYLYHPAHYWMASQADGVWRVGLTKFAARMLGEMVDHAFSAAADALVQPGQLIGWIEGFKAVSDVYCIAEGRFVGANAALDDQSQLLDKDPYGAGWLYAVQGRPDPQCVDVHAYQRILDEVIDRLRGRNAGS